ncbi:MAG: 50S ribosomal protein L29 [Pseudomonadota bacterium]
MKAQELRDMTGAALEEELLKLRREQFNLRMALATGQDAPQQEIRRVRRAIARIKTVMTEAENKAAASES